MYALKELIDKRRQLQLIAENYPLALAKLWVPHCQRYLGETQDRPIGCRQPMKQIGKGLYHCQTCNITEKRTSQREAISQLGETATSLFGGNRSGKTIAGAMLAVAIASGRDEWYVQQWLDLNDLPDETVPNRKPCTVIASALSYADAIAYIRDKLVLFLPKGTKFRKWGANDRATAFLPNGGKIYSMSADSGRKKYQGLGSVGLAWLDEEHTEQGIFEECLIRCVDMKESKGVLMTLTPLLGITWSHELFISNPPMKNGKPTFVYHQLSGLDNPYVSSTKMLQSIQHMSEESKASRLYGEFTNQAGVVYNEFDRNIHILDDLDISNRDTYQILLSIDFGVVNPFSCLVIAYNGESLFVIDEYYQTEKTTLQNGYAINAKFHRYKPWDFVIADSESKDGRMLLARQCGIENKPSPKSGKYGLVSSINLVKQKLCLNAEGKPSLYVLRKCKNLLKEFRQYRWAKTTNGTDRPIKKWDHGLDALRYCVSWLDRYNSHL